MPGEYNPRSESDVYASPLHSLFVTRKEAADLLRVSVTTIDIYHYRGLIKKYRVNASPTGEDTGRGRILYKREELLALVKEVDPIPQGEYKDRRRYRGNDPEVPDAPTQEDIHRAALKRYDAEGHR